MTRSLVAGQHWLHRLPPLLFSGAEQADRSAWLCPLKGFCLSSLANGEPWQSPGSGSQHSHSPWPNTAKQQPRQYSGAADRESFEWLGGLPHPAPREPITQLDTGHLSPTDVVWPASRQQQKVASRVQTALGLAFMDAARRDLFMNKLGLSILEVRMSPDHMTAYVLWEAYESEVEATRQALLRSVRDIRGAMARHLHIKRIPRLEFRHNILTDAQEAIETELERLELERQLEQLQSGS